MNATRASLRCAHLNGAWLVTAEFDGAGLSGANLMGAYLNFDDRNLLSAALLHAAWGDVSRQMLAAWFRLTEFKTWDGIAKMHHPEIQWLLQLLAGYVREGDSALPLLRKLAGLKSSEEEEQNHLQLPAKARSRRQMNLHLLPNGARTEKDYKDASDIGTLCKLY